MGRLGELLALKWEDVHLDNRTLFIAAQEVGARKAKKARSIPISDRLAAVLEMRRTNASLAQTSRYLHADEFVLPDVMRQFEQRSKKRGAVVVQERPIDQRLLHHSKGTETRKSSLH